MPSASPSSRVRRRIVRLATIALLAAMLYPAAAVGPEWFIAIVPPSAQFHALVRLLRWVQSGYIALLAILPGALVVLTAALILGRRRRWPARGLALCVALAIGLALAEAGAAVRLAWTRVPMPWLRTSFPDPPGERTVDIVVLGESSALGVPYHGWLSAGRIVAWKLEEAMPDRRFPITYLAQAGFKLDQVHQIMQNLERRPDLAILYAGHNEFQSRYDWGHGAPHYADETPPPRVTFQGLVRAHSPICRLIDETIGLLLRASPPTRAVTRHLVDVPVYTAAEYAARLHDFRVRLEAMTAYCERVGALVVLVIPPGNDADFEPNRSFLPSETTRADREAFARDFAAARRLEAADPAEAVAAYRALLDRQPGFAETHFRLARLLEAAGRRKEANAHYIAARDRDGLPMRCPSDFQDIYREVAARHRDAILIDGPAVLRDLDPRGTVGDNVFTDGFHPSLIGYTGLAEAILRGLRARRAFGWGEATPAPIPAVSPSDCARHFGMDADKWDQVCGYAAWFYQQTAFIRFDPSERLAKRLRYLEARRRILARTAPEDVGMPGVGTRLVAPAERAAGPLKTGPAASSK